MGNVLKSKGKRRNLENADETEESDSKSVRDFYKRSVSLCVRKPKLVQQRQIYRNNRGFDNLGGLLTRGQTLTGLEKCSGSVVVMFSQVLSSNLDLSMFVFEISESEKTCRLRIFCDNLFMQSS